MPPEIILGPDDDHAEAARTLIELAGPAGTVEVRTARSGPAFEVDDKTYRKWKRRHQAGDDERAANAAAAEQARLAATLAPTGAGEVPASALTGDPAGVGAEPDGDKLPPAAVNEPPPDNGITDTGNPVIDGDDDSAAGAPDDGDPPTEAPPAEPGDPDVPAPQPAPEPTAKPARTARKATRAAANK